jgi:hypothetical protein
MKARLFPTLLISLAVTLGTTLASRLSDTETPPAMSWGLYALMAAFAVLGGGWLFVGARREWRRMSQPQGVCPNCGHEPHGGAAPCPECGRPVD